DDHPASVVCGARRGATRLNRTPRRQLDASVGAAGGPWLHLRSQVDCGYRALVGQFPRVAGRRLRRRRSAARNQTRMGRLSLAHDDDLQGSDSELLRRRVTVLDPDVDQLALAQLSPRVGCGRRGADPDVPFRAWWGRSICEYLSLVAARNGDGAE